LDFVPRLDFKSTMSWTEPCFRLQAQNCTTCVWRGSSCIMERSQEFRNRNEHSI